MYYHHHHPLASNRLLSLDIVEDEDVTEPVTLEQVKSHLAVTASDDDVYLTLLIKAARGAIEKYTGLSLVEKTVTVTLDNYEGDYSLPYGPVIGTPVVLDGDGDEVDSTFSGTLHPNLATPKSAGLSVSYVAGYDVVPADLKLAILHEIAYQFQHRGDEIDREQMSPIAKGLAKPHRRVPKVL